MSLGDKGESLQQPIKPFLMGLGANRQHKSHRLAQPQRGGLHGFLTWQRPEHWIGNHPTALGQTLFHQPLADPLRLHQMQGCGWVKQTAQQTPDPWQWASRREIAFRHHDGAGPANASQQQIQSWSGGDTNRQIRRLTPHPGP
jgi:hypothetical protein